MRKLTRDEFVKAVLCDPIYMGITEEEIDLYYHFFNLGRQSVRW